MVVQLACASMIAVPTQKVAKLMCRSVPQKDSIWLTAAQLLSRYSQLARRFVRYIAPNLNRGDGKPIRVGRVGDNSVCGYNPLGVAGAYLSFTRIVATWHPLMASKN